MNQKSVATTVPGKFTHEKKKKSILSCLEILLLSRGELTCCINLRSFTQFGMWCSFAGAWNMEVVQRRGCH